MSKLQVTCNKDDDDGDDDVTLSSLQGKYYLPCYHISCKIQRLKSDKSTKTPIDYD